MNVHSLAVSKEHRLNDRGCKGLPDAAPRCRPHTLLPILRSQRGIAPMTEPLRNQNQDEALVRVRRQQIFAAACRVLRHKSFHEATVKEMALEAGLAAGSIYIYLQSKDEILLLLAESMVGELVDALPAIRSEAGDDPRRELLGIMRAALDVIDRYREAFAVLNHEVRYLEQRPEYRAALKEIIHPYRLALGDPLERGRALGLI